MPYPVSPVPPAVHTVLISPQFPSVLRDLRELGVSPLLTDAHPSLPGPVRFHADLLCYPLPGRRVLLAPGNSRLDRELAERGWMVLRPARPLGAAYPDDTPLCAARVGGFLLCRRASTEPVILSSVEDGRVLDVRQGYARCSTLAVDGRSLITADPSIARAAEKAGLEVLRIRPGFIRLDGYGTGFLGGCAVRLGPDRVYLTGRLTHPDAEQIREFVSLRGVSLLEGSAPGLIDAGGGVPLDESPLPLL